MLISEQISRTSDRMFFTYFDLTSTCGVPAQCKPRRQAGKGEGAEWTLSSKWGRGAREEHAMRGRVWAASRTLDTCVTQRVAFQSVLETAGGKFERNRIFLVS